MFTALTYLMTSLTLAILLPWAMAGSGHERFGDVGIYRYPKNVARVFLLLMPVYMALLGFVVLRDFRDDAFAANAFAYGTIAAVLLALLTLAYLYFNRYRVQIGAEALSICNIFHVKTVPLGQVAFMTSVRDKSECLAIYDASSVVLAKVYGSLQDFDGARCDIERFTRSPRVMLYRATPGLLRLNWQEKANDASGLWVESRGPGSLAQAERRSGWLLAAGLVLIAAAVFAIYWLKHAN